MPMGRGLDEQNVLGPLQNQAQYDIVARLVDAAREAGARVAARRRPRSRRPGLLLPDHARWPTSTTTTRWSPRSSSARRCPIIRYSDVDDAVAMANGLDVGLGASVWSGDRDAARAVAARLEAGTVWINSHGGVHPMIPFGGVKKSGYGLEFGVEGLKAVSVPQVING